VSTYRISQLAEQVGLRPSALRFYEQSGLLPAQRSDSGYRLYDNEAVERLRFIGSGKRLGLPLAEIRDLLQVWENGLCTDVRVRLRPLLVRRIAEAEQRAAELDAFVDRLRQALAEIDGPPRSGRCDPGCGFLHKDSSEQPVPARFRLHPPGPETTVNTPPIACTLTCAEQGERRAQWSRLLNHAQRRDTIPGGLRIRLPRSLAGAVADLAAAEQQCCAFATFSLQLSGDALDLEVHAPADGAPLLAALFGHAS
jgi:MerR family transcriptional regulator, copper efflux regulator